MQKLYSPLLSMFFVSDFVNDFFRSQITILVELSNV